MHKVFISFHHKNDQWAKDGLCRWNETRHAFVDKSVDTGDIDDSLSDEAIRLKIRDEYLRDSTVTILLVGTETKKRKHVDWELYSSMFDGHINKKSGIIAVLLPTVTGEKCHLFAGHGKREKDLYPLENHWTHVTSRESLLWGGFEYLPERIVDNLMTGKSCISVTTWKKICENPGILVNLIEWSNEDRDHCVCDMSRRMRRNNS